MDSTHKTLIFQTRLRNISIASIHQYSKLFVKFISKLFIIFIFKLLKLKLCGFVCILQFILSSLQRVWTSHLSCSIAVFSVRVHTGSYALGVTAYNNSSKKILMLVYIYMYTRTAKIFSIINQSKSP